MIKLIFAVGNFLPPQNYVDASFKVFNIPHYFPVHNEAEIIVSVEDCADAIRELEDVVREYSIPVNYLTEVWEMRDRCWSRTQLAL